MEPKHTRKLNELYRDQEPSERFVEAFVEVMETGELDRETERELLESLYNLFPDRKKDLPVDPFEPNWRGEEGNGLASAVRINDRIPCIDLRVSEKLYWQQPIGVLLRPFELSDRIRKAGEAVITDVSPLSADVEPEIMPAKHYALRIEPTPIWLSKWVGEDGYPTC